MEKHLNKRILGAVVTVVALAIAVPIVIDGSSQRLTIDQDMPPMPDMPDWAEVQNQQRIRIDLEQLASGEATAELATPAVNTAEVDDPVPAVVKKQPERAHLDETALPYAWVVQLGAFSSNENATSFRDNIRGQGFKAFSRTDDDGLTRVFVGPELQQQQAEVLRTQLEKILKRKDLRIKRFIAR
ncbi:MULTISPECIES: SPOR domain-containing protein [Oceanospirillaceae]|jgi:DedD protein|uniref:SPOR domain-containing protein n=1 Tax=Oceanobacter antarcticus TaxID=3133425 RepID=A0ABW8NG53_9GAMM|tara:strand:- start:22372 stop:22926 length:555 start_codon:yes stop_codon:yes gene_type:complete